MINEIFIDDDIWGNMYAVEIPDGGTLTAEWGNGETEQATIKMIMFERNGLNRKIGYERQSNNVRLSTDAEQGITTFGLITPWTYGFSHYGRAIIDTSHCPSLQKMWCAKVSSLSLSQNMNLQRLGIWYSDLAELDLSSNHALESLQIHNCDNIRELDLSKCRKLEKFKCTAILEPIIPLLLDGGSCEIDWGDGHKSMLCAEKTEWLYGMHIYSRECTSRQVLITSETGNIIGMIADNWTLSCGISVNSIDMSKCQSLQYFAAENVTCLDINTNPGIRTIDLSDCRYQSIDFSNSTGLEHLYIRSGIGGMQKVQSLNLTKCRCLQTLGLNYNPELTIVTVSENSFLKGLVYENTPLNESTVRNLTRIIERNGGKVIKVSRDDNLDAIMYNIETSHKEENSGG